VESKTSLRSRDLIKKDAVAVARLLDTIGPKIKPETLEVTFASRSWICLGALSGNQIIGLLMAAVENGGRKRRIKFFMVDPVACTSAEKKEEAYSLLLKLLKSKLGKKDYVEIVVPRHNKVLEKIMEENHFVRLQSVYHKEEECILFRFGRGTKSPAWKGDTKGIYTLEEIFVTLSVEGRKLK
jgi:hypothetical protein